MKRLTPQNSSLPPSSQHPHAKLSKQKKSAKGSRKKRGGQPGHPRQQRTRIPTEDCAAVIACVPDACRQCGEGFGKVEPDPEPLRQQVGDVEINGTRSLGGAWDLAFTPDGTEIVSLQDDLKLRSWSTRTAEPARTFQLKPSELDIAGAANRFRDLNKKVNQESLDREDVMELISDHTLTADASHVVLASRQQGFWVFEATARTERYRRNLLFQPASVSVSPDGRRIAIGGRGPMVRSETNPRSFRREALADLAVFHFDSGDPLWNVKLVTTRCGPVRFSPDGRWIAAVTRDAPRPTVRLYDAATGEELHTILDTQPVGTRNNIAFSPDGKSLAIAQIDATILTWELATFGARFRP